MTLAELKDMVESVVLYMRDRIPGLEAARSVVVVARPALRAVAVFFDGAVSADDPAADGETTAGGVSCFTSNLAVSSLEIDAYKGDPFDLIRARAEQAIRSLEQLLEDNRRKNAAVAVG